MGSYGASTVPLAVRIRNGHYDGMLTGYLRGGVQFTKTDPGGYASASFVVDQRLGFRTDMIQPYSRIYFYNRRNGETVWEGDVAHPGRSWSGDGALLQVQVEGAMERLRDWTGQRVFLDTSFEGWEKNTTSITSTEVLAGEDRGGSPDPALTLAFPMNTHVDTNFRCEAIYRRIDDAGQQLGLIDYNWDAGITNASWLLRLLVSPSVTTARTNFANTAGGAGSLAYVGPSWTAPKSIAFLQLLWNSGSSSTGNTADVVWASFMNISIMAYLWRKDGTRRAGVDHGITITSDMVWEDLLGDAGVLGSIIDGPNAEVGVGNSFAIDHFVFPDGTTAKDIGDELMKFESRMTYLVGASKPSNDLYTFQWVERLDQVRYEVNTWIDEHSTGNQPVEQYNRIVTRYRDKTGRSRSAVATITVPEMDAVGRTRTLFQDLSNISGTAATALESNTRLLEFHQTPKNGGTVVVAREIVDLFTGRRIQPYEVEPSFLVRVSGFEPHASALQFAVNTDGKRIFRIVSVAYDSETDSASLELDTEALSLMDAITAEEAFVAPRKG